MSNGARPLAGEASAWSHPLARHLAVIVALKLAFLFLLWFAFFRLPDGSPEPGSDIHHHIAGPGRDAVSTHKNEATP